MRSRSPPERLTGRYAVALAVLSSETALVQEAPPGSRIRDGGRRGIGNLEFATHVPHPHLPEVLDR